MSGPARTVLVLPGLRPDPVARVCGLLGMRGHLAPQPGCLLVILDPPPGKEVPAEEISVEDVPDPDWFRNPAPRDPNEPTGQPADAEQLAEAGQSAQTDADEAVGRLSAALRRVKLLRVDLKNGYLTVQVWQRGRIVDTPPAGVVAQQFPDAVLGLVHGSTDPATLPSSRPIITGGDGEDGGGGLLRRLFGR